MLVFSLGIAAILLAWVAWIVSNKEKPNGRIGFACVAIGFCPFCCQMINPPVIIQSISILLLSHYRETHPFLKRNFMAACTAFTVFAFVIMGGIEAWRVLDARRKTPFESIEELLPLPDERPKPMYDEKSLKRFEQIVDLSRIRGVVADRATAIRELHENALNAFVNQPGFGSVRMPRDMVEIALGKRTNAIDQPGPRLAGGLSAADVDKEPFDHLEAKWHENIAGRFASPYDFGYVKGRDQVAGFRSHAVAGYGYKPDLESWEPRTLDLLGLVVNEKPVVYVSNHLPRMEELRKAPKRELDLFESRGLQRLRDGEDIFSRDNGETMRVLGAIRNAKQCVVCHGGQRGDLLGAFSYTFSKKEK